MPTTTRRRVVAVAGLLVVLAGLCVWYGTLTPAPALGSYPGSHDIAQSPSEYVDREVSIGGTVVDTDPVVIELDETNEPRRVVVTDLSIDVEQGDALQVFGVLTDPTTVRATNAYTVPPWGLTYTYVVSFLAGLWVLTRLLTQWQFDPARGGLAPRATPLRPYRRRRTRGRSNPTDTDRDA